MIIFVRADPRRSRAPTATPRPASAFIPGALATLHRGQLAILALGAAGVVQRTARNTPTPPPPLRLSPFPGAAESERRSQRRSALRAPAERGAARTPERASGAPEPADERRSVVPLHAAMPIPKRDGGPEYGGARAVEVLPSERLP